MTFLISRQLEGDPVLTFRSEMERVRTIALFCISLKEQGLTVEPILAGVRHGFILRSGNVDSFSNPQMKALRKGVQIKGREASKAKEKNFRYSINEEMIRWLRASLWPGDLISKMTYLSISFAYAFPLRPCAYCWDSKTKDRHSIFNEDVSFWLPGDRGNRSF